VFWNDDIRANVDPFTSYEEAKAGLWPTSWDFKVSISPDLTHITQFKPIPSSAESPEDSGRAAAVSQQRSQEDD
jgi:hypothetical protein